MVFWFIIFFSVLSAFIIIVFCVIPLGETLILFAPPFFFFLVLVCVCVCVCVQICDVLMF